MMLSHSVRAQVPDFSNALIKVQYNVSVTEVVTIPDSIGSAQIDPLDRAKLDPAAKKSTMKEYFLPDSTIAEVEELVSHAGYYNPWMDPYPTIVYLPEETKAYTAQGNLAFSLPMMTDTSGTTDSLWMPDPDDFGYAFIPQMPSAQEIQEFNNNGISVLSGTNGQYTIVDGDIVAEFDPQGSHISTTVFQNGLIKEEEDEYYQYLGDGHYRPVLTQQIKYENWLNGICAKRYRTTRYTDYTREDYHGTLLLSSDESISQQDDQPSLVINPFTDQLEIRMPLRADKPQRILVIDASGKLLIDHRPSKIDGIVSLDMSSTPSGMYTVLIYGEDGHPVHLKALKL
ncbi:MAG: T9SS type A sorting domain-containing protein [Saprospiraceae bacterium]|nr:T9SS type A sorting domain-containing protein [Saprospiraceae bacterium]